MDIIVIFIKCYSIIFLCVLSFELKRIIRSQSCYLYSIASKY